MLKKNLAIVLLIFFALTASAQNFKIGHRQMLWVDSSRNNRQVLTELYYPADTKGEGVPVASGIFKFATVVFGHGYQLTYANYLWLKDSLVPKGYFVAFPRTEEELFPDHTAFAKDLAFITQKMNAGNSLSSFFFYKRLNGKFAVSGHSMGGGCSLLSVQYSNLITTVCPFAAAETNPSAIAACSTITIPAVLFAGKQDCVTPPYTNQIPMYDALSSSCKTYIEIKSAKHCHWANNSTVCTLGEFTCGGFSTNAKPTLQTTMSLMLPWLNAVLYNKLSEFNRFNSVLQTSTAITYQQLCSAKNNIDKPVISEMQKINIMPSPVTGGNNIFIEVPFLKAKNFTVTISNDMGNVVYTKQFVNNNSDKLQVPTNGFHKGYYFVNIVAGEEKMQGSFMVAVSN